MIEEEFYLSQEEECPLCNGWKTPAYTKDHIFPLTVFKKHRELNEIKDRKINLIRICTSYHREIDMGQNGKISAYRKGGMVELVRFVAAYPRVRGSLYDRQQEQWIALFKGIQQVLSDLNGGTPQELELEYQQTKELLERFLVLWEGQGNFVRFLPTIDLPLQHC